MTHHYFELIAFYYEGVFSLVKQKVSFEEAVNRSLDDFWFYPEIENRLSNLIIIIQYLHIKYAMNITFTQKQIEIYKSQLDLVQNDDLSNFLKPEELEHLNECINNLNSEIDNYLFNSKI